MVHADGDQNSGDASFTILLGAAPHLDGKYTVFGRLESGGRVLDGLLKVPRDAQHHPAVRLEVRRAEMAPTLAALAKMQIERAHGVPFDATMNDALPEDTARAPEPTQFALIVGLLAIALVAAISFLLQGRVRPEVHASLNLLMLLMSAFLALAALTPYGQQRPAVAICLFFGLLGVLKVLGKFERAAARSSAGTGSQHGVLAPIQHPRTERHR